MRGAPRREARLKADSYSRVEMTPSVCQEPCDAKSFILLRLVGRRGDIFPTRLTPAKALRSTPADAGEATLEYESALNAQVQW